MTTLKQWITAGALVRIGSLQMAGDLAGSTTLKALGAITHASPAPKVFTAQNGFETYSPVFTVRAVRADGTAVDVALTPAVNARVSGPYNRRNAYGAVLSYGPVLHAHEATRPMFEAAFHYGFCANPEVIRQIGLPPSTRYQVRISPRDPTFSPGWHTRFEVDCTTGIVAVAPSAGEPS